MTDIPKQRILSLDTLRGFDMFWIIGGDIFFKTLGKQTSWSWVDSIAKQMDHAAWEGFNAYDLIFPLFMFISGIAIPFAMFGKIEKGGAKKEIYYKIIKRAAILILLGLIYNGLLTFQFNTLRAASVLGQVGLAYLIASIIAINFRSFKSICIWVIGILVFYAILQLAIPIPNYPAGTLTPEGVINGYIDRIFLPGKLYGKVFDPEGLLCIFSASAITLMGTLAGLILRSNSLSPYKKVILYTIIGFSLIVIALLLSSWYPIIKSIWTSTFNLLTGGISFILFALFYLIIDVWKFQKWTFLFRVIGLNSITIYMATCMIDFKATATFVFGGFSTFFGDLQPAILILCMIIVEWAFLYFLYKKNIFIKV